MGIGTVTRRNLPWSNALRKPSFSPPNWVFPIVWPTLYLMMGVASWRVWRTSEGEGVKAAVAAAALRPYWVQLGLNMAWSFLYFQWHRIDLALVDSVLLTAAIAWTMRTFLEVDGVAAALLAPYLLWSAFALTLTVSILSLNRQHRQGESSAMRPPRCALACMRLIQSLHCSTPCVHPTGTQSGRIDRCSTSVHSHRCRWSHTDQRDALFPPRAQRERTTLVSARWIPSLPARPR